ncbi:MAG: DUF2726 domain-containing protein [Sphingomonadales bacterium]
MIESLSQHSELNKLVFLLVFGGVILGIAGERVRANWARAEWRRRHGQKIKPALKPIRSVGEQAAAPTFDAAQQLRCVIEASFEERRLLNAPEFRLFVAVEQAVASLERAWRVMAQVSLGEILASPSEQAYRAINSKRVDLLIVDRAGMPLAAIEYQGAGHFQGTAAVRDAVKKEALRRAGVTYLEIEAGDRPEDLRRAIARLAEGQAG